MGLETIRQREWFDEDSDILYAPSDYTEYPHFTQVAWIGDPYIPYVQIQLAFADPFITICDIESHGNMPVVWLDWEEPSGRMDSEDEIASLVAEAIELKQEMEAVIEEQ